MAKKRANGEGNIIELATGLRRCELLGLKWQDIDWKNGIIKVRRQIARVDGQIVEAPLKTKNSYRAVTISPQAIEVLKQKKAKTNDQYVFPSPNGGPISPDSVNNMLKRVLERAGIPKVRFHNLRHTFATIALQNGGWTSRRSPVCWATSPPGSPWTPTPMSPQPLKKKPPRPWRMC